MHQVAPHLVERQVLWLGIGCVVFALASSPPIAEAFLRRSGVFLAATLLLYIGAAWLGDESRGARAWLRWNDWGMQPVELLKVAVILAAVDWSLRPHPARRRSAALTVTAAVMVAVSFWQRDIGPLVVLGATGALWALSMGLPRRAWGVALAAAVPVVGLVVGLVPHIRTRFAGWWNPWSDPYDAGYQTLRSLLALARGGLLGTGWAEVSPRLPAAATDLPAVVIAEALGVAGLVALLLTYGVIFRRMYRMSLEADEPSRKLTGFGLTSLVAAQTAVILAGSVRLIPVVGVTLPLVSYGGSSLVATLLVMGLVSAPPRPGTAPRGGRTSGPPGAGTSDQKLSVVPRRAPVLDVAWRPGWGRRGLAHAMRPVVLLGLAVGVVASYWVFGTGPALLAHPLVRQVERNQALSMRGGILARDGETRLNPLGGVVSSPLPFPSLAHVVGYADLRYGVSGLEAAFDDRLTGRAAYAWLGDRLFGRRPRPLRTTIDPRVQAAVEAAWPTGARGAVVVLDPWTGEILGMLSAPAFSPDRLDEAMEAPPTEAPLFNRALQGRYPPGSTWKLVVLAAALESGVITPDTLLQDAPRTVIDGKIFRNAGERSAGALLPADALAVSSNVIFARLALRAGADALATLGASLGVGTGFDLPLPHARGQIRGLETPVGLAAAGIGQGELLVTPLEMALVTAAIANGGYAVQPRIVLDGDPPADPRRVLDATTAQVLQAGMLRATRSGTAAGRVDPTLLAGKTGTAENAQGDPHAWFVGFAPAASPRLVIAVLVEHGGSGAGTAAAIAESIVRVVIDM